jgi:hypothetical protein
MGEITASELRNLTWHAQPGEHRVGSSEYRYSAERGQWLKVSGDGPEAVTPVQDGGQLVCFEACTLPNYTRVHTFRPGDVIWVETVRETDIVFVPYGGVLALRMELSMVDRHWRSPPPAEEKKPYQAPAIREIGQNEVMRRCVKELRRLARPLDATIVLHGERNIQVELGGTTPTDAREVQELVDCLGTPVVVTAPARAAEIDPLERMSRLAESFPCMRGGRVAGVRPWSATTLATASGLSHGEHCVVQFLLSVWNPSPLAEWKCGRFDVQDALGVWSGEYLKAFVAWAAKPWWP